MPVGQVKNLLGSRLMNSRRGFLKQALGLVVATGLPWPDFSKPVKPIPIVPKQVLTAYQYWMKVFTNVGEAWAPGVAKVIRPEPDKLTVLFGDVLAQRSFTVERMQLISPSFTLDRAVQKMPLHRREQTLVPVIHPVCMCNGDTLRITHELIADPDDIDAIIREVGFRVEEGLSPRRGMTGQYQTSSERYFGANL